MFLFGPAVTLAQVVEAVNRVGAGAVGPGGDPGGPARGRRPARRAGGDLSHAPGAVYTDPNASWPDLKRAARGDRRNAAPQMRAQAEALFLGELLKTMRSSGLGQGSAGRARRPTCTVTCCTASWRVDLSATRRAAALATPFPAAVGGSRRRAEPVGAPPRSLPRGLAGLRPMQPRWYARAAGHDTATDFESQSAFVTQLWPHAQRVGQAWASTGG